MIKEILTAAGILFPEQGHACFYTVYSDDKNYDWLLSFTASQDKDPVEDPSLSRYSQKKRDSF